MPLPLHGLLRHPASVEHLSLVNGSKQARGGHGTAEMNVLAGLAGSPSQPGGWAGRCRNADRHCLGGGVIV